MRTLATALLFVAIGAARAGAQELTAAVSTYGSFGIDDLDGTLPTSVEIRVSLPLSDRFAFEPFFTAGSSRLPPGGVEGFYGAQIRQRLARLSGASRYVFVTYGGAGYYSAYGVDPPVVGLFGLGLNARVSARVAFRPEVQLVSYWYIAPIGARLAAGLSVNLSR